MSDQWVVQIVHTETGEIVKETEPTDGQRAERIERGMNINLNHEMYHTLLKPIEEKP